MMIISSLFSAIFTSKRSNFWEIATSNSIIYYRFCFYFFWILASILLVTYSLNIFAFSSPVIFLIVFFISFGDFWIATIFFCIFLFLNSNFFVGLVLLSLLSKLLLSNFLSGVSFYVPFVTAEFTFSNITIFCCFRPMKFGQWLRFLAGATCFYFYHLCFLSNYYTTKETLPL